jgi:demethoxyubiquinone hydroxylase (CLK1/Coq7/Cat5 family)
MSGKANWAKLKDKKKQLTKGDKKEDGTKAVWYQDLQKRQSGPKTLLKGSWTAGKYALGTCSWKKNGDPTQKAMPFLLITHSGGVQVGGRGGGT